MVIPEWFVSPGTDAWWQQQQQRGLPFIERLENSLCRVTFLWRDPQGTEKTSPFQHVWINITGITDHHQPAPPRSLQRVTGSDVWYWQTELPADWRGSYCLIPDTSAESPERLTDLSQRKDWWREKFAIAGHDPLNPLRPWQGGRGMSVSPLHMPEAPCQADWAPLDQGLAIPLNIRRLQWHSQRLNNQRPLWLCETGRPEAPDRPLVLLLDGQFWAEQMPIAAPLQSLTDRQKLPPAIYVMIDTLDRQHRSHELPCNEDFWLAVQQEILPLISRQTGWQPDAARTLVAGESFGGLAAVYATLNWPDVFGNAVSLSGSFWWPQRGGSRGVLTRELDEGHFSSHPRKIYLEAGRREPVVCQAGEELFRALQRRNIEATLTEVEGGHDALCWRGGLLSGLQALLGPGALSPFPAIEE